MNKETYQRAMQRILMLAKSGMSSGEVIAHDFIRSLVFGQSKIDLRTLSFSYGYEDMDAILTILAGFRDYEFRGFEAEISALFDEYPTP